MWFNSLVLVFYVPKFTFSTCYYIKNDFWPNRYWFILSYSFQAFVWLRGMTMPSSSGMTIYRNRLGQFRTLNIRLESFWSHCLVVSVQFLGHSIPFWVSSALSSGHLDPLTIPLSFFKPLSDCHEFGYDMRRVKNSPRVVVMSKRCRTMSAVLVTCRHVSYIVGESLRYF